MIFVSSDPTDSDGSFSIFVLLFVHIPISQLVHEGLVVDVRVSMYYGYQCSCRPGYEKQWTHVDPGTWENCIRCLSHILSSLFRGSPVMSSSSDSEDKLNKPASSKSSGRMLWSVLGVMRSGSENKFPATRRLTSISLHQSLAASAVAELF